MTYRHMMIDSIRVAPSNLQRVVILREKDGKLALPIWIGPAEADAIAVKLQDITVPRPLTHDFVCALINVLGASVESADLCELKEDTFYAKLVVKSSGGRIEVDCRPSDAIAVAIRVGAPIRVRDEILRKAGIEAVEASPEEETLAREEILRKAGKAEVKDDKKEGLGALFESVAIYTNSACREAERLKSNLVTTGHILLGLQRIIEEDIEENRVFTPTSIFLMTLFGGLDSAKLTKKIEKAIKKIPEVQDGQAIVSTKFTEAINLSIAEAVSLPLGNLEIVRPEHILIGLSKQTDGIAAEILQELGVSTERLFREIIRHAQSGYYEKPYLLQDIVNIPR